MAVDRRMPATGSAGAGAPEVQHIWVLGHRIRVGIWRGSAQRTPVLMFNGIGARIELLAPLAEALADTEVISFELPGAGGSRAPLLPYTMRMVAFFTSRLLTRLGYERVDVLGVSWGGMAAQQFALQYPRRSRRLVLIATNFGVGSVPGHPATLLKLSTPRRFNDPSFRRRIAGEIYGGSARTRQIVDDLDDRYAAVSRLGYLWQQLALVGWTSAWYLPLLKQPTLILAGDDDPIIPLVNARLMTWLIRRSRLRVFRDGHLFFLSDHHQTARVIREFLDGDGPDLTKGIS
jgi:poly(3-hydroxyoctanoate) depolymerase